MAVTDNKTKSLEERFLEQSSGVVEVDRVIPVMPGASIRTKKAALLLNQLASEIPQYIPAMHALVCYPIMKWALMQRKELGLDRTQCMELLPALQTELRGKHVAFKKFDICKNPRDEKCFEYYEKIIAVIDDGLDWLASAASLNDVVNRSPSKTNINEVHRMYMTVHDVHNYGEDFFDVSNYMIKTFYVDGVRMIVMHCGEELMRLVGELDAYIDECNAAYKRFDKQFDENPMKVNTKGLCAVGLQVSQCWNLGDPSEELDTLFTMLQGAVPSLQISPKDPEKTSAVIGSVLQGHTGRDALKEDTGMSWNSIKRYAETAYNMLGCLYWGYSVKEIIEFLWAAQADTVKDTVTYDKSKKK